MHYFKDFLEPHDSSTIQKILGFSYEIVLALVYSRTMKSRSVTQSCDIVSNYSVIISYHLRRCFVQGGMLAGCAGRKQNACGGDSANTTRKLCGCPEFISHMSY